MKKAFVIIIALLLVFALYACEPEQTTDTSENEASEVTSASDQNSSTAPNDSSSENDESNAVSEDSQSDESSGTSEESKIPVETVSKNANIKIGYTESAPVVDGKVGMGEYGAFKIHTVDYRSNEFVSEYDEDESIKADFYMVATSEYLHMAWVVHTDIHWAYSEGVDYNGDGEYTLEHTEYMWKMSCVKFMLCTGAPDAAKKTYQTKKDSGNYMEAGLAVISDGSSYKSIWSKPKGGEKLYTDDWDFYGYRDEGKKTTTYEVRIPWDKVGIEFKSNGFQFGLTYAIGDQEDFDTAPNMVEWQDAILGEKNMDAGAIITFKTSVIVN